MQKRTFEMGEDRVEIEDTLYDGQNVRLLLVNRTRESATYNEKSRRNELVFRYMKELDRVYELIPEARDTLLLGGAGFSFPKHYIASYPERRMDVVELNGYMYDLALDYFYLDELYRDYGPHLDGRLNIFIEDGNRYLKRNRKTYDVIINDAYTGNVADQGLLQDESTGNIRRSLKEGGFYAVNLITALKGFYAIQGMIAIKTLKRHFPYVGCFPCTPEEDPMDLQNCLLLASDHDYEWEIPSI